LKPKTIALYAWALSHPCMDSSRMGHQY